MTTHLTKIWWDLNKHKLVEQAIPEAEIYKREWVDLTDEQIEAALLSVDPLTKRLPPGMKAFAQAVGVALKEENT